MSLSTRIERRRDRYFSQFANVNTSHIIRPLYTNSPPVVAIILFDTSHDYVQDDTNNLELQL